MSIQLTPTADLLAELRRRYPRILIVIETPALPAEGGSIRVVASGSIIEVMGLVTYADTMVRLAAEQNCRTNFNEDVF
jgi:hypothetical protein